MTLEDMAPTRPHAGGNDARHVRPRVEGEVAAGRVNVTIDDQRAEADADDEYTTFTDLGYQGEYEGVERVSATIELDGAAVGRAELVLVHRERVQHFLMACDAESQDLVSAGSAFFQRDGATPKLGCLAGDDDASVGTFAYVASFQIDDPAARDPRTDVATEALRQLKALVGGWGIAVYIPEAAPHATAEEEALAERMRYSRETLSEAEKRAARTALERGVRRDMTPFLRVGFRQVDELLVADRVPYLYCTSLTWLSVPKTHECASADDAVTPRPPPPVGPSGADESLQEYLIETFSTSRFGGALDGAIAAEVGRRVQQEGACVKSANALHCAAVCPPAAPLVDLFCALGGDINARDPHGNTPLMVCAGTLAGMGSAQRRPDTSMLRKLVASGADTSMRDEKGRTPLDMYRNSVADYGDMLSSVGVSREMSRDPEIEALLRPAS